jgi:hypothetical protein
MKKLLLILLLATAPLFPTGCSTPPSGRNVTVATLLVVGHTAEAALSLSAQLYADGKITNDQAYAVFDIYNNKFRKPYELAVVTAKFDKNAIAPAELMDIANKLTALVASYRK